MTEPNPGLERPQTNLVAALRQCPNLSADDATLLLEAARADLQAWTHTVAALWSKDFDLVEKKRAA